MRITQILYNKAHWIFEAEEMPTFPPSPSGNSIILVDITDKPEVQEGWDYDIEADTFSEPVIPEPQPEIIGEPTIEEEMLYETKYQTMILEMGGM